MDIRNGKCFDCGAEYKIPASFPHDVARCKACGKAVTIAKLGDPMPTPPVRRDLAPPAPAKKVAPKLEAKPKLEEYVPSGKKSQGPSMMERLRQERVAAAEPKAATPAPKQPATAARPAKSSGTRAAAGAKPTRKSAGTAKSGSRAGAKKRRDTKDAGDSRKRSERSPRKSEKKSPVMAIGAIAFLVVCGAVFMMKDKLFGDTDPVEAGATTEDVAATDSGADTSTDGLAENTAVDTSDEPMLKDMEVKDDEAAATGSDEEATPEPEKPAAPPDEGPDTTLLPDVKPMFGATAEDVAAMDELMVKWMDPYAGRAGNRARDKLVKNYRMQALATMINAMKNLDLSTEEGHSNGDQVQKALQGLFFEKNFGWKYPSQEPDKYLAYNRKAVRSWHTQIEKIAEQGIEYFIAMTGLEKKKSADSDEFAKPERAKAAAELRVQYGDGASSSSSTDTIDSSDDDEDLDID